jgi:histidine triad (HIT) family protein
VIPKKHVRDIWALDKELACALIGSVLDVSRCLRSVLQPEGLNVISSAGEAASQTIFHLHIHVVPRWHGDHIGNIWPPPDPWTEHATDDISDRVRAACAELAS